MPHESAIAAERQPAADTPADRPSAAASPAVPSTDTSAVAESAVAEPAAAGVPVPAEEQISGEAGTSAVPARTVTRAGSAPRRIALAVGPGRISYGLAWCAVAVLAGTSVAFTMFEPPVLWTLRIAFGLAGVLAVGALHGAAVAVNRRRDTGFAGVAAGLVLLALPMAAAVTLAVSGVVGVNELSGSSVGSGSSVPAGPGSSGDVTPPGDVADPGGTMPFDDQSEVIPDDGVTEGMVWCEATDGTALEVDPRSCVNGIYVP